MFNNATIEAMNGKNWRFFSSEPINMDQKLGMKGGNQTGIQGIKVRNRISDNLHFEITDN